MAEEPLREWIARMSLAGYSLKGRTPPLPFSASPAERTVRQMDRLDRSAMPKKTHGSLGSQVGLGLGADVRLRGKALAAHGGTIHRQ
jgi:hypothetical protein